MHPTSSMKIPPLPRPVLGHTLTEARRVLGFLLPPLKLDVYDKAVSTLIASSPAAPLRPHLDGATILAENDLTSGFKPLLLSNRAPMSHSMTITLALRTNTVGQISVAANLLTRLAMVATAPHEHLSVSQKGEVLNPEQTSLFLGTTRRVGPEQDTLVSSPLSRHVIVWSNGQPFALDVLNAARIPYSEASLEAALKSICDQASRLGPANSSVADSSWKLSRSDWFVARKSIEATESNRNAFALIDTALATIALEPFKAPADAEGKLEAIRSGHNSVNRYADQVVSIVVFHDGSAGISVDHAPVDGGLTVQFANKLSTSNPIDVIDELVNPASLQFTLPPSLPSTEPLYPEFPRSVRVLSLGKSASLSVLQTVHTARLIPFIIHISVQVALRCVSILCPILICQPVSMRHFANGRANPSFPLTTASSRLVDALVDSQFDVSQPVLTALLREALVAHKEIIRDAKLGASVGPHLDLLRSTVAQVGPAEAEPIVQAWARIGGMNGPTAIVTGFDEGAGVLCGMGNLWKEDLFTCWYNIYSNADTIQISLTIAANGAFLLTGVLDRITTSVTTAFDALVQLANNSDIAPSTQMVTSLPVELGDAASQDVPFLCTCNVIARLSPTPTVRGQVTVSWSHRATDCLFDLQKDVFAQVMTDVRKIAAILGKQQAVKRVALASDGETSLHLFPLHGLGSRWARVLIGNGQFSYSYLGYVHSKDAPRMSSEALESIRHKITELSRLPAPFDTTFYGSPSDHNLFACIVRGELEQWRVWEDSRHIAFLSPYPNVPGFTVLIPRRHLSSDILALDADDYDALILAAYEVGRVLRTSLGSTHVGLIFEGYEIDYAHVKRSHAPLLRRAPPPKRSHRSSRVMLAS